MAKISRPKLSLRASFSLSKLVAIRRHRFSKSIQTVRDQISRCCALKPNSFFTCSTNPSLPTAIDADVSSRHVSA